MRKPTRVAALAVPAILMTACDLTDGPLVSGAGPEPSHAAPALDNEPGLDGEFVRLARQIPGFGGYWFDESGDLVVSLTDLRQEGAARAAVAGVAARRPLLGEDRHAGPATVRARKASYDFVQLQGWRVRLRQLLGMPGMVYLDVDEAANRVRIGAQDYAIGDVRARVAGLGVPAAAVIVESAGAGRLVAGPGTYTRPVKGGLRIHRVDTGQNCTLGYNVYYNIYNPPHIVASGARAFMTASHCTAEWLGSDGAAFRQGGAVIGQELWDPPFLTSQNHSGCPGIGPNYPPARCRYSDAAVIQYNDSVSWRLGGIVRTRWAAMSGSTPGDTVIDVSNPEFSVTGVNTWPSQGQTVYKMGATTGWTGGRVDQACVDRTAQDGVQPYVFFCQYKVVGHAWSGDSGSPVFTWSGGNTVGLAGIVWRLDDLNPTTQFWFSSIGGIQQDFGVGFTYF